MRANFNKPMYVGGQLLEGGARFDVICPATEKPAGNVAWAGADDARAALEAADAAFESWSGLPIAERAKWMLKLRDAVIASEEHLRECVHLEMGKTWEGTQEDFESLVNSLAFYAEEISRVRPQALVDREGTHSHELRHEAAGVAAAFLAWNFPLLNLAFKIGPAMAAGCPLVVKPSFKSPLSAYAVGELCAQIGLPAGAVNILCGDDAEVGDALSSSEIPALLTLIGSARTGRRIMRRGSSSIKRYSMELGGNAPALVFADADLDLAADIICAVKFGNAGQICVTPNRIFAEESVMESFREKVVARAKKVRTGFTPEGASGAGKFDMGPLIDRAAWERVDGLVRDAVADGAKMLVGGGRPAGLEAGHFYAPTVLDGVTSSMRIYREEIFGPVAGLTSFADADRVLRDANDTETGLTAYVFTSDLALAERCARRLRFGEVQINGVKYGIDLPHGGVKQSGMGCDCSHLALYDYLSPKRVSRALAA